MILNSPYITGSLTVTGNANVQGTLTVTGSLSGTASLALNSNLLQGTGSTGFTTTASFNAVSSSQQQISSSLLTLTASYTALSSSYTALSGSYNTFSGSASTRITANSASIQQVSSSQQQISASLLNVIATYATTGSNSFRANQSITGSLVVSSTITAQTLVVQTVTSSIVYSSGSNIFGSQLANTQTFTGSVNITGSVTATDKITVNNNNSLVLHGVSTSTGYMHMQLANANNTARFAVENIGGGTLAVGSIPFSTILNSTGNYALHLATNNTVRVTVNNSGSVGIGTTSPGFILDVKAATNEHFYVGPGVAVSDAVVIGGVNDAANANTPVEVRYATTFALVDSGTIKMVVSSSNVGIGTITPAYTLDVNGTGRFSGDLSIAYTTANLRFFLNNTTATTGRSWYFNSYSNGNLYVGNTTAGDIFNFSSAGAATFSSSVTAGDQIRITGTTANALYLYGAATVKPYITINEFGVRDWKIGAGTTSSGKLSITATLAGIDGITIDGSGNVGVGTSAPAELLHVYSAGTTGGNIRMTDAGLSNADWSLLPSTGNTTAIFRIYNRGTAKDVFNASTAGTITFNQYTAGSLSTNSSGVIAASDGRYKTKTRSVTNALDAVMQLNPTYYRWNEDSEFHTEYEELGFIAQEVASVIPAASPEPEQADRYKNYHDRAIIAVLTKAIQELQAQITELKNK